MDGWIDGWVSKGFVGHSIPHFEETALDANASAEVPVGPVSACISSAVIGRTPR